jgi:hypothetical protein
MEIIRKIRITRCQNLITYIIKKNEFINALQPE